MRDRIATAGPLAEGVPPTLPEPAGPMGVHIVPTTALAMPDDQEQMTDPDVGDSVSYTVEGVVESIDGMSATVRPTAINGEILETETAEPTEDVELSELRTMAQDTLS